MNRTFFDCVGAEYEILELFVMPDGLLLVGDSSGGSFPSLSPGYAFVPCVSSE